MLNRVATQMREGNQPTRKSRKPCNEFGCGNLTRKSYCKTHEKLGQENIQETNRQYNTMARDGKLTSLYNSHAWQRLRSLAMDRDNHLCQWCLDLDQLNAAQVVHHKVEVRDDWSRRLDLDNLICLCHACHNKHHKKGYPRGK